MTNLFTSTVQPSRHAKNRPAQLFVPPRPWRAAILIVFAAVAADPAQAGTLSAAIRKIKPSIVGVATCQTTRRPPIRLRGTGFAVADGLHVMTNFHVIPKKIDRRNKESLCVIIGRGRNPRVVTATLAASDPEHDVAILVHKTPKLAPVEFGNDGSVAEGDRIAFTGFPIGAVLGLYPVTHRGIISARTPIAIPQISPRRLNPKMIKRLRNMFDVFQLDAIAYPGNSGSPVYSQENGRVLAIVSSVFVKGSKENMLKDPSGITYAIPIVHARNLLRRLGIGIPRSGPDRSRKN